MNMRTPFDQSAQQTLTVCGAGYKLSLPIEAKESPGIEPVPQSIMVRNGIVGLYVTAETVALPEMIPHLPWITGISFQEWFSNRPTL